LASGNALAPAAWHEQADYVVFFLCISASSVFHYRKPSPKVVSGVLEFRQPHAGSEATGVPANQRRESPAARFRQNGKRDMNPTKVVIVGAGFDGLAAAKALWKTPAKVLLIDGTNACEPRQFAIHEVRR
jgi:NADPH-dependent 2,4-dienoyl-CoA reductase/sulfur reductase-like enzyme